MKTRISADELRAECLKERYSRQLTRPEVFPSEDNWKYIIDHRMTGIGSGLYRKYLVSWLLDESERCDYHLAALKYFPDYAAATDRSYILKVVYGDIKSAPAATIDVIEKALLFDARTLLGLMSDTEPHTPFVVECLKAYQPEYTLNDLYDMLTLLAAVRDPDPLGEIRQSKGLLGSSTKYICPNGHVNDADSNYCHAESCGLNIYGLTAEQDAMIDDFEHRIKALEAMLK